MVPEQIMPIATEAKVRESIAEEGKQNMTLGG